MKLKLKEDPKEWFKFTVVMVIVAVVITALLIRSKVLPPIALVFAGVFLHFVLAACWVRPVWFRGFYRTGMTMSFRIGQALLETTGWCQPCARLEERLGPGTFQAMCGHGGITARVIEGGIIRLHDAVQVSPLAPPSDPQDNEARQGWRARLE